MDWNWIKQKTKHRAGDNGGAAFLNLESICEGETVCVCVCVIRNVGKRFCLNVRGNGKVYEMVLFIFTVHSINRQVGLTHSPTTVDVLYW